MWAAVRLSLVSAVCVPVTSMLYTTTDIVIDVLLLSITKFTEPNEAGLAPQVILAATHELTLEWCDRAALIEHAADATGTG